LTNQINGAILIKRVIMVVCDGGFKNEYDFDLSDFEVVYQF